MSSEAAPLELPGLRSKPLSRYLCAAGLLRVLAEQHPRQVRARWSGTTFVVEGIDEAELLTFLLEQYQPAPVVSPWNKEGDPTQNPTTASQIDRIAESGTEQLARYRSTIAAMRSILESSRWRGASKDLRITQWRSAAPDVALPWIDAAVVLTSAGPEFPALLGTGGNDGRFEISRLYQKEVIRLFLDPKANKNRAGWLESFLFNRPGPALVDSTVGQFDPDATGGINSSAQGSAASAANPWAILFTIEGAQAFRSGAASRLGFGRTSTAAAPFTVKALKVSDLNAPGEVVRAEMWAPVWERFATWAELSAMLGEGRLAWKGRQARTSLDARRAVATLGADRGIQRFERYGFAERNGLAYVAVHSGSVSTKTIAGVGLLASLDQWVSRLPRGERAPEGITSATRQVERAQFELADEDGKPAAFQKLLIELGRLEEAVGKSTAGRERVDPISRTTMPSRAWMKAADDGSPEVNIAVGLASLRQPMTGQVVNANLSTQSALAPSILEMGLALRSVSMTEGSRRLRWSTDPAVSDPAARRRVGGSVVFDVLRRRLQNSPGISSAEATEGFIPFVAPFPFGEAVELQNLVLLLNGRIDIDRVLILARAFGLLNWSDHSLRGSQKPGAADAVSAYAKGTAKEGVSVERVPEQVGQRIDSSVVLPLPPWFAALKLCFLPDQQPTASGNRWIFADHRWPNLISAGRTSEVVDSATQRLRYLGTTPRPLPAPDRIPAETLAIALLCRLQRSDVTLLRNAISPPRKPRHSTQETT